MHLESAYLLALLIGLLLGIMGSGGSILTVPILVYAFHIEPIVATFYSLFIVGTTTLVGSVRSTIARRNDIRAALIFAPASVVSVFAVRKFLLPSIPYTIHLFSFTISKNEFIIIFFALLMVAVAYSMLRKQNAVAIDDGSSEKIWLVPVLGFIVGAVTGFVGAGGGFLIIPSLVLFARVPMKKAIGTSLLIITINCFVGFLSDSKMLQNVNWNLLFIFSGLSIVGILIGLNFQKRIPGEKLKKAFAYFILVMAVYIIYNEVRK